MGKVRSDFGMNTETFFPELSTQVEDKANLQMVCTNLGSYTK